MRCFHQIRSWMMWFGFAVVAWIVTAAPVMAQSGEEIPIRNWAASYFLVLLCVVLGIMVVGRSARRRERLKPEDYQAKMGAAEK